MPEDVLRYLRGYPLTHDASETTEYTLLRYAFVRAIAYTHPRNQAGLQSDALSTISQFFTEFDALFTTNYDLLAYWAMMTEPARTRITDLFAPDPISSSKRKRVLQYDASRFSNRESVRYLHGALHLAQRGPNVEKLARGLSSMPLIRQIHQQITTGTIPLIVVEGTDKRKMKQIRDNQYLADAYAAFHYLTGILVTYGWGFNLQDQHLVDAILRNQNLTEIWISAYGDITSPENREMQARINRRRDKAEQRGFATPARIIYYDADSVPF